MASSKFEFTFMCDHTAPDQLPDHLTKHGEERILPMSAKILVQEYMSAKDYTNSILVLSSKLQCEMAAQTDTLNQRMVLKT